jgi:hypothetical protein
MNLCIFSSFAEVEKFKPYSPFQDTKSKGEYVVARLDDLMNWGRKVSKH